MTNRAAPSTSRRHPANTNRHEAGRGYEGLKTFGTAGRSGRSGGEPRRNRRRSRERFLFPSRVWRGGTALLENTCSGLPERGSGTGAKEGVRQGHGARVVGSVLRVVSSLAWSD